MSSEPIFAEDAVAQASELLDKQGFSVGEIDGKSGPHFKNALAAFQADRKLAAGGEPDCATWQALRQAEDRLGVLAVNLISPQARATSTRQS